MAGRKCEVKSHFCSGELLAYYTFKKSRGDTEEPPKFWCCGACKVTALRGAKPIQLPFPEDDHG